MSRKRREHFRWTQESVYRMNGQRVICCGMTCTLHVGARYGELVNEFAGQHFFGTVGELVRHLNNAGADPEDGWE